MSVVRVCSVVKQICLVFHFQCGFQSCFQDIVNLAARFLTIPFYFSQRIGNDAQIAFHFANEIHYFARVAQNFNSLRVRIITNSKRSFNG